MTRRLGWFLLLVAACSEDPDVHCDGDSSCLVECPDGFCNVYCEDDAVCEGGCEGGECTFVCTGDARCDVDCPDGSCALFCQDRASCECEGCRTECGPDATCL